MSELNIFNCERSHGRYSIWHTSLNKNKDKIYQERLAKLKEAKRLGRLRKQNQERAEDRKDPIYGAQKRTQERITRIKNLTLLQAFSELES